jgi:hypothetical protein
VRIAKCRHILELERETRQPVDYSGKFRKQKIEPISQENQVCVVGYITASGSPVDDSCSSWCNLTICTKVSSQHSFECFPGIFVSTTCVPQGKGAAIHTAHVPGFEVSICQFKGVLRIYLRRGSQTCGIEVHGMNEENSRKTRRKDSKKPHCLP